MLKMQTLGALVVGPRQRLGGIALALAASSCGQHFDLGEIAHLLEEDPPNADGARAFDPSVIVNGPDDLDVIVANERGPDDAVGTTVPLGDVDGDGFGDWIGGNTLFYGGARPQGRTLDPGEGARFEFGPYEWFSVNAAGDVNGDGLDDFFLGGDELQVWAAATPPDGEPERFPIQGPGTLLVLGSHERLQGDVDLTGLGIGFGDRDQLADAFDEEMARNELDSSATQATFARALGDLDGDGFADFSVTTSFHFSIDHPVFTDPDAWYYDTESVGSTVTYVHYGSRDLAEIATPAARLDADVLWSPLGDLDGDGYREVLLSTPDRYLILPGTPERQQGRVALERALPIDGILPDNLYRSRGDSAEIGDFDGDGYDDLILGTLTGDPEPSAAAELNYLFYGGPGLLDGPLSAADAGAVFVNPNATFTSFFESLGDWDGDGLRDLLFDHFLWPADSDLMHDVPSARQFSLLRGTQSRFAGAYTLPQRSAAAALDTNGAGLTMLNHPAGDLDGDGHDDLFVHVNGSLGIKYGRPAPKVPPIR